MKTKQTTKVEVLTGVLMTYHRWSERSQVTRRALARIAYRKAGMALSDGEKSMQTISAAWHEQKTRLGRNLTSTELADIYGWAT